MKEILFILIAFMLCSVTAQAKKKISMKRVACITISVDQEEFETDDGVNYFVGEFCTFCERNGIAARVNNTTCCPVLCDFYLRRCVLQTFFDFDFSEGHFLIL